MTLNDPLSNTLSNMQNAEKIGKKLCYSKPVSIIITKVLDLIKANHYIGDYKIIHDNKGGIVEINLLGRINKCNVIKPRYSVKKDNYVKYEKRYLPASGFGILIVSTTKGIMTHEEAKAKKTGGRLLAYCY